MSRDGILLLGGNGFIGSALSVALCAQGCTVHVIGRSHLPPSAPELPGLVRHAGSLDDSILLEARRHDCSTVVHLASASTPGSSARDPVQELGNVVPMVGLLEQLRHWPQTHLVFLSSGGTVYGNPASTPVAEDALPAPLSYYGAGKLAMEGLLQAFRSSEHPVTILRPSNCYGPGQTLRYGFGLIRTVLQQVSQNVPVEIWGDGESVRDYLYIDDLVAAILQAIARPADNGTYNIGNGCGHSINAILDMVAALDIGAVARRYRPARSIDVRTIVLDNSRAAAALDWRPEVGVADGIGRTWDWLRNPSA